MEPNESEAPPSDRYPCCVSRSGQTGTIDIVFASPPKDNLLQLRFEEYDDGNGPLALSVRGPDGKVLVQRVIREVPTPMSPTTPPVELLLKDAGRYQIEVRMIRPIFRLEDGTLPKLRGGVQPHGAVCVRLEPLAA